MDHRNSMDFRLFCAKQHPCAGQDEDTLSDVVKMDNKSHVQRPFR